MTAGDVFLLIVRWLHLVCAAAWVGGSIFYLLVLMPATRNSAGAAKGWNAAVAAEFRGLVDVCIIVLVATGAILSFERLTGGIVGVPFVVTLGLKILLTLWMFYLALSLRRRRHRQTGSSEHEAAPSLFGRLSNRHSMIVILGVLVLLVSDLLKVLYESALVK